ncbi:hypothetical protein JB92DRAFT_2833071 [Gautieria morchelliformis]|nr:hypothetical protein JB92DRAFT_2833071 [Gautieria morchelliformis]
MTAHLRGGESMGLAHSRASNPSVRPSHERTSWAEAEMGPHIRATRSRRPEGSSWLRKASAKGASLRLFRPVQAWDSHTRPLLPVPPAPSQAGGLLSRVKPHAFCNNGSTHGQPVGDSLGNPTSPWQRLSRPSHRDLMVSSDRAIAADGRDIQTRHRHMHGVPERWVRRAYLERIPTVHPVALPTSPLAAQYSHSGSGQHFQVFCIARPRGAVLTAEKNGNRQRVFEVESAWKDTPALNAGTRQQTHHTFHLGSIDRTCTSLHGTAATRLGVRLEQAGLHQRGRRGTVGDAGPAVPAQASPVSATSTSAAGSSAPPRTSDPDISSDPVVRVVAAVAATALRQLERRSAGRSKMT